MNTNSSDPFGSLGFGDAGPWLDFVNSEFWDGYGNFTELLDNPAWLTAFLRFWNMRQPADAPPLRKFRRLRSQLRKLVEKTSSGKRLRMGDLTELNEWLKIPSIPQLEEDQNGWQLVLEPIQSGWHVILAYIASSFAESLVQHGHKPLKICENADCRWIFMDESSNNARRWCNNATCGNRDRVRKARAAQKRS